MDIKHIIDSLDDILSVFASGNVQKGVYKLRALVVALQAMR